MEVVRSDDDTWGITGGVGYTALVVAGWRALHTAGPHPIARDEYARGFVTASADQYLTGLLADPPTAADAAVFPRLYGVQTRFFDEFFGAATRAGIRQAVIVAAGLDCRAYRLPWPVDTTLFELDQPGLAPGAKEVRPPSVRHINASVRQWDGLCGARTHPHPVCHVGMLGVLQPFASSRQQRRIRLHPGHRPRVLGKTRQVEAAATADVEQVPAVPVLRGTHRAVKQTVGVERSVFQLVDLGMVPDVGAGPGTFG